MSGNERSVGVTLGLYHSMKIGTVISEQGARRSSGIVAHNWKWRFKVGEET